MLVTGSYLCVAVHCKDAGSTNPVQGLGDVHIYNLARNSEQKFMAHLVSNSQPKSHSNHTSGKSDCFAWSQWYPVHNRWR